MEENKKTVVQQGVTYSVADPLREPKITPHINISGAWLSECGFTPATPIKIRSEYGKITLSLK